MAKLLIANGAWIYITDKQGKRPLDLAVEQGDRAMIELLKPLHTAVEKGELTTVKELLGKNPDSLNIKDENGWYPLHLAVKSGHMEIFKFLVARGPILLPGCMWSYSPANGPGKTSTQNIFSNICNRKNTIL